jgi:subtilisin family serine protease
MLSRALSPRLAGAGTAVTLAGIMVLAGAGPAQAAPSDQIRDSQQWVLDMLDVPAAWQVTHGAGVTVAVIDSGVSPSVSDLSGSVTPGPNLTGLSTPTSDSAWGVHGTWMASIIAGHGHDGGADGIIGVAPRAGLLSIRVIPDKGDPEYSTYNAEKEALIQQSLASGIIDAAKAGVKVISMSIGYSAPSSAVRAAVQYAESRGVVLVASSGNSGQDLQPHSDGLAPVSFPAEYPGVLSVGAVNASGAVASFSSGNLSVQVAAPGVDVPAEGRDGNYWLVSGTSPACALVAGVAALVKAKYPGLSPVLVDQALTSTARSHSGYNPKAGFGTVDAAAALRAAGQLAAQRAGTSPEAASGRFGGGPAAVPAPPVAPRSSVQGILFALLGLLALGLVLISGRRLVRLRKAEAAMVPAGPPEPAGYREPAGYPAGYPGPESEPASRYPDAPRLRLAPEYLVAPTYQPAPPYPAGPDYQAAPQYPRDGQYPGDGQYPPSRPHPAPPGRYPPTPEYPAPPSDGSRPW